jgi:hypothetical protein
LRILLLVRLYTAIYLSGDIFDTDGKDQADPIGPLTRACRSRFRACLQASFLKRIPTQTGLRYRCALAIALAPLTALPPAVLARHLVAKLTQTETKADLQAVPRGFTVSLDAPDGRLQTVQITAAETGWIDFEVTDRTFAAWLQTRLSKSWGILPDAAQPDAAQPDAAQPDAAQPNAAQRQATASDWPDDLWLAQYAHARCCAILRGTGQADRITRPDRLAPLGPDCISPTAIGPDYPSARQLALVILDVADRLEDGTQRPDRQLYLTSAQALGQAFADFSQTYQWGQPATDPSQFQTQLGLVILLQSLLQSLLTQGLGQPAPTEL